MWQQPREQGVASARREGVLLSIVRQENERPRMSQPRIAAEMPREDDAASCLHVRRMPAFCH